MVLASACGGELQRSFRALAQVHPALQGAKPISSDTKPLKHYIHAYSGSNILVVH